MTGERPTPGPGLLARFRRGYLVALGLLGWLPAALWGASSGWRAGAAALAAAALAGGDFLWVSFSFSPLFAPGAVSRGAAGRAVSALTLRMALLLLGLYATLRILPGQGGAVAAGLAAPLLAVAAAGVWAARG